MEAETTESGFTNEIVTCCSCKENLAARTPYLLTCFHGICRQCCDSLVDTEGQVEQKLKCPLCSYVSQKEDIIANKFVKIALPQSTATDESQSSEEKTCTGCEESVPATSYCVECQEYLCDQCVQAHRRVKMTKEHNIQLKENAPASNTVSLSTDEEMTCHMHPKEQLKLFCETCDKLTCRDCQLTDHKDHKYYFVEEAGIKMRSVLHKLLERMRDKKNYVEKSKSLISNRRKEIQECQNKVSDEIKMFALKIISEVNKRGKTLMEDLTSLCNAKKQQLDEKGSDLNDVSKKLEHVLQFVEFCSEKGSSEALLFSKRILVKHLKEILQARCDIPNPNHKLDIRFNWDPNFVPNMVPKQGVLLVDGINYEGLSNSAKRNLVQGNTGSYPSQHQPLHGQYMNLSREQQQAVMMKTRQQYVQQQQQRGNYMGSSRHGSGLTPPPVSMGGSGPFGAPRPPTQHQGMVIPGYPHQSQYNKPHQSAAISSSDPMSRRNQSMLPPYQNIGNPPTSSAHFQTPHLGNSGMSGHHGQGYQNRSVSLMELQEQRLMMRKQQGPPPSGAPPPSPIVIAPEGEEHYGHLMPTMAQRGNSVIPSVVIPGPVSSRNNSTSPHGSNTSSPVHVGSTTSNSPEQRPRSRTMETEISSNKRLKGESSERPSCSYSTSPKPSQVEKTDKNRGQMSINDFTFDQDPMSFIKNINQEIDLNPEATLGLISVSQPNNQNSNMNSNEAVSRNSKPPFSFLKSKSSGTTEDRTDVVGSSETVISGKGVQMQTMNSTSLESDPNEDWCAVCNNGGDLLCCDDCPKVFHLKCHVPSLKQSPSGHWSCNMCKKVEDLRLTKPEVKDTHSVSSSGGTKRKHPVGLTEKELKVCERILLELYAQESSLPFHEPVSKSVPNYYKIITHPMDFSTIKHRLRRSSLSHYPSIEDFLMDIQIVFTNCARYNAADSEMGIIGKKMESFFHSMVRQFLPYIDIQPVSANIAQNSNSNLANGATVSSTAATTTTTLAKGDSNGSDELPPKPKIIKKTLSVDEAGSITSGSDTEDGASPSGPNKENKSEGRQKLKLKLKASYKLVALDGDNNDENNGVKDSNDEKDSKKSPPISNTAVNNEHVQVNNKTDNDDDQNTTDKTNTNSSGNNTDDINKMDTDGRDAAVSQNSKSSTSPTVDTTASSSQLSYDNTVTTELSLSSSLLSELPDLGDETESLEGMEDEQSKDDLLDDPDYVPSLELDLTDTEVTPSKNEKVVHIC